MSKRFIAIYLFIVLLFSFIGARLFLIMYYNGQAIKASLSFGRDLTLKIFENRGLIYDKNLVPLVNETNIILAVVDPFLINNIDEIKEIAIDEQKEKAEKLIKEGRPFLLRVHKKVENLKGVTFIDTKSRYSLPYLALHTIGYLNNQDKGEFGIENSFEELLSKDTTSFNAVIPVGATRRALSGLGITFEGQQKENNQGVVLTIDKNIQKIAETAADLYISKGAIVILNIETGEIVAICSRPNFNPYDIGNSFDKNNGALINKALTPYNVGSAFKIVLASAYYELGGTNEDYYCGGSIKVGANTISCQNSGGHGEIGMQTAFAQSCNVYFIKLGGKIGAENLLNMAINMGFFEQNILSSSVISKKGTLPTLKNLSATACLANFSIGQGELLATPLQIAQMVSVVAGDGSFKKPYLIKGTLDKNKNFTSLQQETTPKYIMSKETADKIKQLMIYTAISGSGKKANPDAGGAGVKTATAQTGIIKDEKAILQGWIAGFFPSINPKYAVAVLAEDCLSGAKSAGPAFKYIAENVYEMVK